MVDNVIERESVVVKELRRKSLHMLTILYPILYNVLPYRVVVICCASLIILDVIFETLRLLYPSVNNFLLSFLEGTYREKERENISTLIWTFSGAFITILVFSENKNVVTLSLLYLVFGDSVAAITGVIFGSIRLGSRGKSLEGSLAFFLVAFICGVMFFEWWIALISAMVATAIEFLPLPVDDNFILPIISAGLLTALL